MIAVFAILNIFPFGYNTVMTGDTTYQLVDYLSYYRTILSGNNDLAYSLSKNMGGEMAGFAAYYLYSPLNLLTMLFSKDYLFAGIGLIIILVPGLASLSMCFVLKQLKEKDEGVLIFSLCYGLSAYIVVYNELLYYYTNIVLLPLIFLFLRKMTDDNRYINVGYVFTLSFAVINNYYTGYMICIFLGIYMIFYLLGIYEGRDKVFLLGKLILNSALAVFLSSVTLIPAVLSLSGEKDNFSVGLYLTFSPLFLFSKLYSGSFTGDFGSGLPNIYCGVIISLLLAIILFNKEITLKKRIFIGGILLFFWLDFCVNTINVIWHGLNQPIGFPYRQAFVVVFFCIVTAFEYTDFNRIINKTETAVFLLVLILYGIYSYIRKIDNLDMVSVIITTMILIFYLILFLFPVKNRLLFLLIVTVIDLSFNAAYSLSHFYFTTIDEYQQPLLRISKAVKKVEEFNDEDVFRMEKLFRRTNNDAMMFDYAGLTHFSSSEKKDTISYLGKLGFRDNGNWALYTGENTALADSILGVRYVLSQFDSTGKPYTDVYDDENGEFYIYKNTHAIPVLSAVDDNVFHLLMSDDPFENQNNIADSMSGTENHILYPQNAERTDHSDGMVSFDVDIQNDGALYCFFSAPDLQNVRLFLDGDEWTEYFGVYNWSTVQLENRKKGDKVHVDLVSDGSDPVMIDDSYFAVIDYDNMIKWSESIRKSETTLFKCTSSLYTGEYDTDKNAILISLPNDKGWHVYIDGKEYEIEEACGHMIGVRAPSGRHKIKMRFIPPGRRIGCTVSFITFLIMLIYCIRNISNIQYLEKNNKQK